MSTAWNIVTGIAAVGIGFAVGSWKPSNQEAEKGTDERVTTAVTFTGQPNQESGLDSVTQLRTPIKTFRDAGPRLKELIEEFKNLTSYERFQTPVVGERILQEMERYLVLANEADLISWIKELDLSAETTSVIAAAIGILAKRSPSVAAQTLLECGGEDHLSEPLLTLIRIWDSKDSTAVPRWIESLPEVARRDAARQTLLLVKASTNPELALSMLDEIDPAKGFGYASVLGETLDLDRCPEAATALLENRSLDGGTSEMLPGFLASWATRDSESMYSWLFAQDLDAIGSDIVGRSLSFQVSKDPESVIEVITPLLGNQPALRQIAGQAWWGWITKEGQEENAIEWLRDNSASASDFGSWQVADRFARSGDWTPERTMRVLAALKTLPASESLVSFSQDFLERLSRFQGKVVAEFAADYLPLGSKSDSTIARAVGNWAEREPEAAIRWSLENLDSAGARGEGIRFAITKWGETDPRAAAAMALSLPEKERNDAFWGLAFSWAEKDPQGVISFLKEASDPVIVSSLTQTSFRHFSEHDRGAAHVKEALSMPPGKMRHDAVRGLFSGWALSDATKGVAALDEVPEGTLRDAAIQGFNGFTIRSNPKLAIDLATRISVAATRDKELVTRGRYWLGRDRAAAEMAIRKHPAISDTVKAEIFK